jgi:hypothetical protein
MPFRYEDSYDREFIQPGTEEMSAAADHPTPLAQRHYHLLFWPPSLLASVSASIYRDDWAKRYSPSEWRTQMSARNHLRGICDGFQVCWQVSGLLQSRTMTLIWPVTLNVESRFDDGVFSGTDLGGLSLW